jgi:predicted enzyme related to lactoylglutathione lyase
MTNSNFPTLGPIIIGTKSIPEAKKFYLAVFGITIKDESPHYLSAKLVDGTHIEIEEDSENRFPNWAQNNIGTYKNSEFFVADIKAFLQTVVDNGGSVVTAPVARPWGGFGAEFKDPEGNMFLVSEK